MPWKKLIYILVKGAQCVFYWQILREMCACVSNNIPYNVRIQTTHVAIYTIFLIHVYIQWLFSYPLFNLYQSRFEMILTGVCVERNQKQLHMFIGLVRFVYVHDDTWQISSCFRTWSLMAEVSQSIYAHHLKQSNIIFHHIPKTFVVSDKICHAYIK